ncbi:hypothetical protein GCM10010911_62870 [Paenibacillus nasutitermitis]|uniref:Uncharacterized protein n=1 Tax=Paenibacillus nasutitermitis TaxID=1652958 RepID=A0A917E285_9BACL|nr:hypothetical protein GCM10010911_62870 [Paenibacillus nasutitermitis]
MLAARVPVTGWTLDATIAFPQKYQKKGGEARPPVILEKAGSGSTLTGNLKSNHGSACYTPLVYHNRLLFGTGL